MNFGTENAGGWRKSDGTKLASDSTDVRAKYSGQISSEVQFKTLPLVISPFLAIDVAKPRPNQPVKCARLDDLHKFVVSEAKTHGQNSFMFCRKKLRFQTRPANAVS